MLYIKYSRDKKKLNEIIEGDSKFQSVDRQAAEVINVVTGSKLKYPGGKGSVNMCLAIQQMREESELIGQIKGAVLMCKDLGLSLADTIKRIAEKFNLSEKESSDKVKQVGDMSFHFPQGIPQLLHPAEIFFIRSGMLQRISDVLTDHILPAFPLFGKIPFGVTADVCVFWLHDDGKALYFARRKKCIKEWRAPRWRIMRVS